MPDIERCSETGRRGVSRTRGRIDVATLADTDDLAIPAVAVAEYLAGTLLDADPGRAAAQRAFLDEVLDVLPVDDYGRAVADHHAELLAHVQRTGSQRGVHDLVIAATARAAQRIVLITDDRARFGDLPDVTARVVA